MYCTEGLKPSKFLTKVTKFDGAMVLKDRAKFPV